VVGRRAGPAQRGDQYWCTEDMPAKHLKRTSSGRGGRRFKSCHSDQYLAEIETLAGTDCGTVSLTAGVGERQPSSNSKLSDEQRQRLVVSERKD
jgi:hypothetical protein